MLFIIIFLDFYIQVLLFKNYVGFLFIQSS